MEWPIHRECFPEKYVGKNLSDAITIAINFRCGKLTEIREHIWFKLRYSTFNHQPTFFYISNKDLKSWTRTTIVDNIEYLYDRDAGKNLDEKMLDEYIAEFNMDTEFFDLFRILARKHPWSVE